MALAMVLFCCFLFKSVIKSSLLAIKHLGRNGRVWDSQGKGWRERWAE